MLFARKHSEHVSTEAGGILLRSTLDLEAHSEKGNVSLYGRAEEGGYPRP